MNEITVKIAQYTIIVIAFFVIASLIWSLLNIQTCSGLARKEASCEQIAEHNSNNCEYIILKWKKVSYEKELSDCLKWERNQ